MADGSTIKEEVDTTAEGPEEETEVNKTWRLVPVVFAHGGKHNCQLCSKITIQHKIKKLQDEIITKLQVVIITLMANVSLMQRKKMKKKEMENNNVIMCQLDEEGSNGKQHCGDVLFPTEETKGKHRRNWYHFISTPSTLSE